MVLVSVPRPGDPGPAPVAAPQPARQRPGRWAYTSVHLVRLVLSRQSSHELLEVVERCLAWLRLFQTRIQLNRVPEHP